MNHRRSPLTFTAVGLGLAALLAGWLLLRGEAPTSPNEPATARETEPRTDSKEAIEPPERTRALRSIDESGGRLVIEFVDASGGEPVAGIEVELLPPVAAGLDWSADWLRESSEEKRALEDAEASPRRLLPVSRRFERAVVAAVGDGGWRRTSGVDGRVAWSGLVPDEGYRVGIRTSSVDVEIEPPHETPRATITERGLVSDSSIAPRGLSGEVRVAAREETRLVLKAHASTRVRGVLVGADGSPARGVSVRILGQTDLGRNERVSFLSLDLERSEATNERGEFAFAGVRPGAKVVAASWESPRSHFHFARLGFDLAPNEVRDLGSVGPLTGRSLEGIARFASETGEAIAASDLFDAKPSFRISLAGGEVPGLGSRTTRLHDTVTVEADEPFVLQGIPDGPFQAHVLEGRDSPRPIDRSTSLEAPDPVELDLPGAERFEFVFVALRKVRATIRADYPAGIEPFRMEAHLRSVATGRRFKARAPRPRPGETNVARVTIAAPAGRYALLLHSNAQEEPERTESWFAEALIDVAEGADVVVRLEPGAILSGIVDDVAESEPAGIARTNVFLGFSPWIGDRFPNWPYVARVGDDGRFRVRGLPPRRAISAQEADETFETGAAGEERSITISRRDD